MVYGMVLYRAIKIGEMYRKHFTKSHLFYGTFLALNPPFLEDRIDFDML